MNFDLTDETQASGALRVSTTLRKQRWVVLAVGLVGCIFLIVFDLGGIPGLRNDEGVGGTIGISFGAAFLAAAGVGSWWLWTRLANFRTRRVSLTDHGVLVEFMGGSTAELNWTDPRLHFALVVPSNSVAVTDVRLQWGSGGIGNYAHITRAGAERVKSEAASRGLREKSTSTGKAPYAWTTTEFSRS